MSVIWCCNKHDKDYVNMVIMMLMMIMMTMMKAMNTMMMIVEMTTTTTTTTATTTMMMMTITQLRDSRKAKARNIYISGLISLKYYLCFLGISEPAPEGKHSCYFAVWYACVLFLLLFYCFQSLSAKVIPTTA